VRPILAAAALLVAVGVAGCVLPEEDASADPLLGVCPYWEDGAPFTVAAVVQASDGTSESVVAPRANGSVVFSLDDHPLDRYRLRFTAIEAAGNGVRLRAFHNETGQLRGIYDFRSGATSPAPFLMLGDTQEFLDTEFDILLTAPEHGTAPMPGALRLEWTAQGSPVRVEASMTPGYRVCGAITQTEPTG
jgi:hypothetical protein